MSESSFFALKINKLSITIQLLVIFYHKSSFSVGQDGLIQVRVAFSFILPHISKNRFALL